MSMLSAGLQQLGNNINQGVQQLKNNVGYLQDNVGMGWQQALLGAHPSLAAGSFGSLGQGLQQLDNNSPLSLARSMAGNKHGSLTNGSGLPWAPGNTNNAWTYIQQAALPETGSGLQRASAAWDDLKSGNANTGQQFANDIGSFGFGDLDMQGAQRTNDIASANTAKANAEAQANATAAAIKAGQQAMYPDDLQESMLANIHRGRTLYGGY